MGNLKTRWYGTGPARLLAGSLFLAAIMGSGLGSAGEERERKFSFAPDPGFELLKATFSGGTTGNTFSYTLFADGHLVIQRSDQKGDIVFESLEIDISYEETTALLRRAVDSGLMEYEAEKVRRKMGSDASTYFTTDGATMTLAINLPSYQAPGERVAAQKSIKITFYSPGTTAEQYPGVEEIQGLASISQILRAYKKAAKGGEKS